MKFGIFGSAINRSIADVVDQARAVSDDGLDSYWTPDPLGLDALTTLALAAPAAPGIELGTAVTTIYLRHPTALAQQALTVSAACEGRFCLGIGLSHKPVVEGMFGLSFDRPVAHLEEYLQVLNAYRSGGSTAFEGSHYRVNAPITTRVVTSYPVIVAALGERALGVAGALADGTFTWCVGPETARSHIIPTITEAAERASRPPPRIIIALPVCVTDDPTRAQEEAGRTYEMYGSLPSYRAMLDREGASTLAEIAIIGNESYVAEQVEYLEALGVTDFVASQFTRNGDDRDRTRRHLVALREASLSTGQVGS